MLKKKTKIISTIGMVIVFFVLFFGITKTANAAWYATGGIWNYRKAITIDHTKVPNTNQTNFPVLIDITDAGLQANAKTDGYDILFTSSDGTTKLSHEREIYTTGTGALTAWVKIPTLSTTVDTVIYMYYGNASATDQADPTNVWDANYLGVWHFGTTSSLSTLNSKTGNTGTNSGVAATTGQIGGAGDYADATDLITTDMTTSATNYTIEYWARPGTVPAYNFARIVDKQANGGTREYILYHNNVSGNLQYQWSIGWSTASGDWGPDHNTAPVNTTKYNVWTYNGSSTANNPTLYIAGASQTLYEAVAPAGSKNSNSDPLVIGNRPAADRAFKGWIDELRISNSVRSSDWVKTGYNNQNSPATFYAVAAEENTISISGTIYAADETTALTTTPTIKLSVAGGTALSVTALADGTFSFAGVTIPTAGQVINIWTDGGSDRASLVFKYGTTCEGGISSCVGLKLFKDNVIVGVDYNNTSNSIANSDLAACDNDSGAGCSDVDIGFTSNAGTLTLTWATNQLRIKDANAKFVPGGAVTSSGFKQSAGTFTGGSATLDINGVFVLSGGTFTSTSGSLQISGAGTGGGTFTHNSGTVVFDGSTSQTIPNFTFNNLTISVAITASTTATITGILTTSAAFVPSAGTITLNTGSSIATSGSAPTFYNLTTASGATVTTSSNFSIAGTFTNGSTASFTASTPSVITMNNSSVITNSGTLLSFYNLTTASGATVTTSSNFSIAGTFTNGSTASFTASTPSVITMNNSSVITNSGTLLSFYNLTIANSATVTANTSYTVSNLLTIGTSAVLSPTSGTITLNNDFTNNGTFTASGTNTVVLATSAQADIGGTNSATFQNFSVTGIGSAKTVKFKHHTTNVPLYAFSGTFTITGATEKLITITSDDGATAWLADFAVAQPSSVTYANISWSGCLASADVTLDATSVDGNNNGTCWVFPVVGGITISGIVYNTTETAPLLSALAIKLAVGAGTSYSTTTNATDGTFSFTNVVTPGVGDILTIWLNTNADAEKASLVFKYGVSCTGTPDCTGLSLYQNRVTVNNKHEGTITNANLAACDNDSGSACSDTDIGFTSAPLVLTFSTNVLKVASGTLLNSWYSAGGTWNYRKAITIDKTKVPNTNQTDFPVLIDITDAGLQANAKTDGYDILFTSDDKLTKLSHEREIYTTGTGALTAWVKIPTLSTTVDTVIYMYYGNASATDQQNVTGVWDSNYVGVWHLPNGINLSALDSTSNNVDGTITGNTTATSGKIDGAGSFDGTDDYINLGTAVNLASLTGLTVSAWVSSDLSGTDEHTIISNWQAVAGPSALLFRVEPADGTLEGFLMNQSNTQVGGTFAGTGLSANTFAYVTLSYDGTTLRAYKNGQVSATTFTNSNGLDADNSSSMYIGDASHTTADEMTGKIDEVRISRVTRSADWVTTEYNNQNSPSTFYAIGSQTAKFTNTTSVTFVPGGDITAQKLSVVGVYTGGSETITLTGSGDPLSISGTFTPNSSTVQYTGTSATNILNTPYYNLSLTPAGTPTYSVPIVWYATGGIWNYRKAITIDKTKVPNTNQTDFPVLIDITDAGLQANAKTDGYDILFTSSDGTTKLSHEREIYTTGTGALTAWVKIPTLSTTVDTVIYMYYGNASATDQADPTNVWDANYKGVWHLADNAANTTVTSSKSSGSVGANVANTNTKTLAGKISNALTYNGSSDKTTISGTGSPINITNSSFTVEAWAKRNSSGTYDMIFGQGDTGSANIALHIGFRPTNVFACGFYSNDADTSATYTDTDWHHWVCTFDSATKARKIYRDGAQVALSAGGTASANYSGSGNSYIGNWGTWASTGWFGGGIDETRVSASVRSADWIVTEYNNQNDSSTFYAVGTQEEINNILTISNDLTIGNGANAVVFVAPAGGITVGGATNIASGTLNLNTNNAPITFVGNVTVTGTLSAPASSLFTLNGDFTNSGTFTHNNGTVTFDPTSVSSILGNSTTFYNFSSSAPGTTLQFKSGNVYTFSGTLNLVGELGNPILISSDSAGVPWIAALNGGITLSYVAVKDASCSGNNSASRSEQIIDRGNNGNCWGLLSFGGSFLGSHSTPPSIDGSGGGTPVGGGEDLGGGSGDGEGDGSGGGTPVDGGGDLGGGGGAAP